MSSKFNRAILIKELPKMKSTTVKLSKLQYHQDYHAPD